MNPMFEMAKPQLRKMFDENNWKSLVLRIDEKGDFQVDGYNQDVVEYLNKIKKTIDEAKKVIEEQKADILKLKSHHDAGTIN